MNKGNSASLSASLLLILGICLALTPTTAKANEAEKYYIPGSSEIYEEHPVGTYTLTTDVSGEIVIEQNDLTLDGAEYTVTAPVQGEGYGVYLYDKTGVTIKNLTVENFEYGIYLESSSDNTLEGNTASNNDRYGIYLESSSDNTLEGNTASNNSSRGIGLDSSSGNTLEGNTASDHYNSGIYLDSSNNNTLENNTASGNHHFGIFLKSSSNNTLKGNTVSNNSRYGIYLDSSNNTLTDNTASNNAWGIYLDSSSGNILEGNTVSGNISDGIHLYSSTGNTLEGNTASSNSSYGIYLASSSGNTIYNNYFNNASNFHFAGTIYSNTWNTTKAPGTNIVGGPNLGGNFWADPNGTGFSQTTADTDGDGICNTGYTLATDNVDKLPLAISISINGGADYTNSTSVSLSLSCPGADKMCFKNEGSSWTICESYSTSKSWTLASGDGEKRVYVRFRDGVKYVSDSYSDTIILDMTPPRVGITSPCADGCVRGEVDVMGSASDDHFQRYQVGWGKGSSPSSWEEITHSHSPVTEGELCCWNASSLPDGTYSLRLTARDLAGNSAGVRVCLKVDNHPPQTTLTEYPPESLTGDVPKALALFSWTGSDPAGVRGMTPSEALLYQYRLEGHSSYQDWSGWSKDTSTTFLLPSGSYTFKVRAKDEAGNYPQEDDPETARYSFSVSLPIIIYPNPSSLNQGGLVTFSNLPLGSDVRVYIYDLGGSLVRLLEENDAVIEGGSKTVTWNLRNDRGEMVARGIYIYHIPGPSEKRTGKIAIIS